MEKYQTQRSLLPEIAIDSDFNVFKINAVYEGILNSSRKNVPGFTRIQINFVYKFCKVIEEILAKIQKMENPQKAKEALDNLTQEANRLVHKDLKDIMLDDINRVKKRYM